MEPRITIPQVALFFSCCDPFSSNGSKFDPFESNGVEVLEVPRQGAQSGGGEGEEETSPASTGSRVGGFFMIFMIFFDTCFGIVFLLVLASISAPFWEPFGFIFNVFSRSIFE